MTFSYFKKKYISFKIFFIFLLRILSSRILFRCNLLLSFPILREKKLLEFLYRFRPYETNYQLVRLGEVGDGGYLIPDDLGGNVTCITAGVGEQVGFEFDLAQRGVNCYMADYSVEHPPLSHKKFHFKKKFIGTKNDQVYLKFKDYFDEFNKPHEDYILKIDIEGDEYKILPLIEEEDLARMRIIILELHHFTNIITPMGYNLIEMIMNRLQKNHTIVHIHPNSYSPCIKFSKKIELYDLLEITFLRNDRITEKKEQLIFPHPLDSITNNFFKNKLPGCFYKKLN
jgi:hypothetical protein